MANVACAVRGGRDGGRGAGHIGAEGHLEDLIGTVIVADEALAAGNGDGGELTGILFALEKCEGREGGRGADRIGAVSYFEVTIGHVVVADEG